MARRRNGRVRLAAQVLDWTIATCLLAACKNEPVTAVPLTRVRAVTVEVVDFAPPVTLSGVVTTPIRPGGATLTTRNSFWKLWSCSIRMAAIRNSISGTAGPIGPSPFALSSTAPLVWTEQMPVATLLTLLFLPALYVAWYRIKEPT